MRKPEVGNLVVVPYGPPKNFFASARAITEDCYREAEAYSSLFLDLPCSFCSDRWTSARLPGRRSRPRIRFLCSSMSRCRSWSDSGWDDEVLVTGQSYDNLCSSLSGDVISDSGQILSQLDLI